MITDTFETANVLNDFFTSVFTVEDVVGLSEPVNAFKKTMEEALQVEFTPDVVLKKLMHLKPYKDPGVDKIGDRKCANVTPLYKKKDSKSQPGNYSPVSLTSQISIMMESIIRCAVVEHLQIYNLIKTSQYGFMKGRSCLTNLLVYLDKNTTYIDEGLPGMQFI